MRALTTALALAAGLLLAEPAPEPSAEPSAKLQAHGGLVASAGELHLELVVGPERLALYGASGDAAAAPPSPAAEVTLITPGQPPLQLLASADHFEAPNPYGVDRPRTIAAVVQGAGGARAARFAFRPEAASTFHDHRAYHGGMVGMVGDRHLELAVVPAEPGRSELQLYVTDAYRRPIALAGLTALVRLGEGPTLQLKDGGGSLVATLARPRGPLDAHVEVRFPGESEPTAMDFYVAPSLPHPSAAADGSAAAGAAAVPGTLAREPIPVRVSSGGYTPARIEVPAGKPVSLRFLRTTDRTCGTEVVFPGLGIRRPLPLNTPVDVVVVPTSGELAFTCGMGMFKGAVVGRR